MTSTGPDPAAVEAVTAITRWYLDLYHDTPHDPGTPRMLGDPARVGAFALDLDALAAGDPPTLFKLLIATTLFQRRQDQQIMRVMRGLSAAQVDDLTDLDALVERARRSPCDYMRTTSRVIGHCDLRKESGRGTCDKRPEVDCPLKEHTVWLKRYGHFGKVPTVAALVVREAGAANLADLRQQVYDGMSDPNERARALSAVLQRSWRISDKISAMFLSAVTNPDLCPGLAPWSEGVDWSWYVVIDSNVDLALTALGYPGPWTYRARRQWLFDVARRVNVSALKKGVSSCNPRLIQQALYVFMSITNRRASDVDCSHRGAAACEGCPSTLSALCPSRAETAPARRVSES